jgi:hypothetical protein
MSNDVSIFFGGDDAFSSSQRVAKALTASTLVPKEYQNNMSNALVALDMAQRMNMNPLMVMQNLHIIHGRPSWSSKAMIAMFNQCGRFGPMAYRFEGEKGTDSYGCVAYAKIIESGEMTEGPLVTMGIAKAEGWLTKSGSKWKTMPDLMLRYRAGSWLVNTVAPDLSFGLNTVDEVNDSRGFDTARDVTNHDRPKSLTDALAQPQHQEYNTDDSSADIGDIFNDEGNE